MSAPLDGERPRMAAAVAEACDFPRGAAFLVSLVFAVTKQIIIFGYKAGSSRAREFTRGNGIRHKNFQQFLTALQISLNFGQIQEKRWLQLP
jgi:hypothetical protein